MSNEIAQEKPLECSFCAKHQGQVKKLVAGPGVFICDECVDLCADILKSDGKPIIDKSSEIPSPKRIKEFLDQYIISQDYAKMIVSVGVHNHYKRITHPVIDDVELEKSNIILVGSTGTGKTILAKTIARMLDVPFAMADATTLTEQGYVGSDPEAILARLLQAAGGDVARAERGIIYIDEIDKKAKRDENMSITRDVSGEGVQQALLKIIEGTECDVPPGGGRKHPNAETIKINTNNILFIVGGAFVGIDKIIERRLNKNSTGMGFVSNIQTDDLRDQQSNELLRQIEPEDFVKFGLIPELVGRLPIISYLEDLDEEQLVRIISEPKNAIAKQFIKLFGLEDIKLEFSKEALTSVAKIARERKTGARGLRSVIEQKLIPVQFELPDLRKAGVKRILVSDTTITTTEPPEYIYENTEKIS